MKKNKISFVFFGTDSFSTTVLDELKVAELLPDLVITVPDKPKGRGMKLASPAIKQWARKNDISVLQPAKLKKENVAEVLREKAPEDGWDVFVVASYGKIIPQEIIDLPKHGTLNVHPSLLPKYRGPSPIQGQILNEKSADGVGVTIMQIDEEMDHGPLLGSTQYEGTWPVSAGVLADALAHRGGKLLAELLPKWVAGDTEAQEQNHNDATYVKMIKKEEGEIDPDNPSKADENYRKFLAYEKWPGVYFFKNGKRIKVTDASLEDGAFVIKKVIPEGKKEVDYKAFVGMN